ncbi:hypothetical protein [Nesterenkonia populi]|uniref:hypothetical protein n=1 Tax=Nesterenkonia populi TaxID=1591087 RepID=UPI0011BF8531|nr:hypothetical protein [Nesterenkonia populi]
MSVLDDLLDEVRAQIEAKPTALAEARTRLQLVRDSASSFHGALRTYPSGSLAVHTMNEPVTDGDGGIVLNRNYYPALGPEGRGEAPGDVVDDLIDHLRPRIRKIYPNATMHTSKRGPKVYFGQPVGDDDPTVDLVVAMNRKQGAGIWIPNLEKGTWEPSDPEKHAALLNGDLPGFRSTRRKIIRLAKAWNKQYTTPGTSSFEISVWAYEFVENGQGVAKGLWTLFDKAAARLEAGAATRDPAGVSPNLKLLIDAERMSKRLRKAADQMAKAIASDDEDEIRDAMSIVFRNYIDAPATSSLKEAATLLRTNRTVTASALGVGVAATTGAAYRAYGGPR